MNDRSLAAALALLQQLEPALDRRDRAETNRIIAELIALRAPLGDQWQRLAQLAQQGGEIEVARRAIDVFVEAMGDTPVALYHKSSFLSQIGAWHEADALLRSLPENVPDPASNAYSRGVAALNFGELDEARRQFERLTQMVPQSGAAWLALARSVNLSHEPAIAERIIGAERVMSGAPAQERAAYGYALGKVHADRHEHQRAFAAFAQGAGAMKPLLRYDRAADRHEAEQSMLGFDAGRVAGIAAQQDRARGRSIFVTGLPRSGTTLVQQILASHSQVCGGAEIERLPLLAHEIGGQSWPALDRYVAARGPGGPARLWQHWLDGLFPGPEHVIDKSISTTRYLGLVAALLPDAPLIWLTRDPLDCAWSCFRTYFYDSLPWSLDLGDIAYHFRLEDRLLAQWRDLLGDRLLVVPYEALVADPESWTRRLLAHCGLAEEPGPFAPQENRKVVTTASTTQVRRPINRDGIGAAEPYRQFLEPFVSAYFD